MKMTTKGRYGLRIMLELALHYGEGPFLLKEISQSENISIKYIHFLINFLKGAGLVKSLRGPKGGYVLAKAPSKITLRAIIEALEGPLSPVDCVDDPAFCDRVNICPAHKVWERIYQAELNVLDSLTLEQLISK